MLFEKMQTDLFTNYNFAQTFQIFGAIKNRNTKK